jgi:hypothetical protein
MENFLLLCEEIMLERAAWEIQLERQHFARLINIFIWRDGGMNKNELRAGFAAWFIWTHYLNGIKCVR